MRMVKTQITGAGKIIWQNKTIICWTLSTSFVILVKRDPELKRLISFIDSCWNLRKYFSRVWNPNLAEANAEK